jgi:hypothetical protein
VPTTAQAAIVFLVIILPGFLAQGGYRLGRAVPEHPQGLVAVARAIALSTVIVLAGWKLGGRRVYDYAQEGTALTLHQAYTWRFAVLLLLAPGLLGYIAGQTVDVCARQLGAAVDRLPPPPDDTTTGEPRRTRARRRVLKALSGRFLYEGPTTWDRTWRRLRRTEPYAYARVMTTGGREIIGLVAEGSRVALSPQPRDLYLEEVLRQAEDGYYYPTAYGLGAFISGDEIESIEWVSRKAIFKTEGTNG